MPGVEAEDVGLRLADQPEAVFLVEGQADRHHVELAREPEHLDLVLEGDAGARQHPEQVAVLVHVGDRRPDVRGRAHAHRLEPLEHRAHVLQRVVRVEARADERVALHRRQDVLLGVVERLPVRVEDRPEHRHRAHAVGAQARAGERVHAVHAGALEQLRHQAAAGAGDEDGQPRADLGAQLLHDGRAGGPGDNHVASSEGWGLRQPAGEQRTRLETHQVRAPLLDLAEVQAGHGLQIVERGARALRAPGDPRGRLLPQEPGDALELHRGRAVQVERHHALALEVRGEVVERRRQLGVGALVRRGATIFVITSSQPSRVRRTEAPRSGGWHVPQTFTVSARPAPSGS